jgi:hypothetical protein
METISPFRRGQVVFHETYGPGMVHQASDSGVEVEFHDGRQESFKNSHAKENLRASTSQGFAARYLADPDAVLRALESDPNEVVGWLSADLGRDLSVRTAKSFLKRLRLFRDDVLADAWVRGARKAQTQPPKRRITDDTLKVHDESQAKDLEGKLWDAEIHIQSRNAIFRALTDFHQARADEDFLLRALFFPLPVARAHAYGLFKKRGHLTKVWDYLIRKSIEEKSAPGIVDIWFRLASDFSSEEVRNFGQRAAEIFVDLQKTHSAGADRLESLRRLVTTQTGSAFSIAKIVVSHLPHEWWDELLAHLSSDDKRRAFQLYFQAAVSRSDDAEAIEGLARVLRQFPSVELAELVISVATFTKAAGRYAFLRRFLQRAADLIAAQADVHDSGLERIRSWLTANREVLDPELEGFFVKLGHPVEARPVRLDRAGHLRRLQDVSVPAAARQSSLNEVAAELRRDEIVTVIVRLASEPGPAGERILRLLWSEWHPRQARRDAAAVLLDVLEVQDTSGAARKWVFARAEEGLSDDIAALLSQRILGRERGEPLDPVVRSSLGHLHGSALGQPLRSKLLSGWLVDDEAHRKSAFQLVRDPLASLGIEPEVSEFFAHVVETDAKRINELTSTVAHLEGKLEDILASDEIKAEIRRVVDESLGAREGQLREESERSLELLASRLAELYVDLATFVSGLRSKTDKDTVAVGEILCRGLAQLLSSRLDRSIIGEPGELVVFDPSLHEPMGDLPRDDEEVLIIRPGIQKTGSRDVASKAVVKRR